MKTEEYIPLIVEKLKKNNPSKIILFGSYANGNANEDSDIDIMVVTSDNFMPKNYDERVNLYINFSELITSERRNVPIDLIVYTSVMYEQFTKSKSMFSREVNKKGKILYERNN